MQDPVTNISKLLSDTEQAEGDETRTENLQHISEVTQIFPTLSLRSAPQTQPFPVHPRQDDI